MIIDKLGYLFEFCIIFYVEYFRFFVVYIKNLKIYFMLSRIKIYSFNKIKDCFLK